jgi:hypothetical protein
VIGVRLDYRVDGPGWADARFAIGDEAADLPNVSYLSDALGDLLRAVLGIEREESAVSVVWVLEPGGYRWTFRRRGEDVDIRIVEFPEWVELPEERGRILLDASCGVGELVAAVARGARSVLVELGEAGYHEAWIEHPFPTDELAVLEALVRDG